MCRLKGCAQVVTHVLPGDTVVLSGAIYFLGRDELESILHLDRQRRQVKRTMPRRPPSVGGQADLATPMCPFPGSSLYHAQ